MPYVRRDDAGKVAALFAAPQEEGMEWLEEDHPEVAQLRNPTAGPREEVVQPQHGNKEARRLQAMSSEQIDSWVASTPPNEVMATLAKIIAHK